MVNVMHPSQRQGRLAHPARPAEDRHPMIAVLQQTVQLVKFLVPVDKPLWRR
jgi:hypothetical protein